jgi:hypothetical protein
LGSDWEANRINFERTMDGLAGAVEQILKSEKLVLIATTISAAGFALYVAELAHPASFAGLPSWVRPTALIVWTISTMYAVLWVFQDLANELGRAGRFIRDAPQRRSQRKADQVIVDRLSRLQGLRREMLCYARFRDDNFG